MEPRIIERGTTLLAGMVFYGDPFAGSEGWSQENEIGRLWGRFNRFWDDHQAEIRHVVNGNVGYELHVEPAEYPETKCFYVMVGVEVSDLEGLPLELSVKVLPAGTYAVFCLRGPEITSNWPDAIYKDWLPQSGYEEAHKFTIERYDGDRFKGVDDPESELELGAGAESGRLGIGELGLDTQSTAYSPAGALLSQAGGLAPACRRSELSRLVQRRIRQLKRVYEQARDVDVLLDFLRAENRAYVRGMWAQQTTRVLNQELLRDGNRLYVQVPPAFCQRRANYLKSLCEGVLGHPVEVSIQHPAWGAQGACRIALNLQLGQEVSQA